MAEPGPTRVGLQSPAVTPEPADGPAGARRAGPRDRALRDLTDEQRRADAVAGRVAGIRRVASARVQREYPSTLRITVVERVPVVGVAPVVERAIPTGVRSAAEEAAEDLWWQTSWIMQADRNTRIVTRGHCRVVSVQR